MLRPFKKDLLHSCNKRSTATQCRLLARQESFTSTIVLATPTRPRDKLVRREEDAGGLCVGARQVHIYGAAARCSQASGSSAGE
jgi:hypothetical protein